MAGNGTTTSRSSSTKPKAVKVVRKLRHLKQRFHAKAAFIWRRPTSWPRNGKAVDFPAGSIVPDWVIKDMGGAKLRRFWESHRIELAEFDAPDVRTGQVEVVAPEPAPKQPKAKGKKAGKKKASKKATAKAATPAPEPALPLERPGGEPSQ
jgi:hypothetical protein